MIKAFIEKLDPEVVNFSFFVGCIGSMFLVVSLALMSCDDSPPTLEITEQNLIKMLQDARTQGCP